VRFVVVQLERSTRESFAGLGFGGEEGATTEEEDGC
jgi:hypothetical protein